VTAMHGRLDVESEVGRGATFTVTLPMDRGEGER
jgi:signal transduction histidine kinase